MSKSSPVNGILSNVGGVVNSILASIIPSSSPSSTYSTSPSISISPKNVPTIVSSPSTSPIVSSDQINVISKSSSMGNSFLSSFPPSNIINVIVSKIADIIPSNSTNLPSLPINTTNIISNLPSLSNLPDLPLDNNLTGIIPFNSTDLPNLPISNLPSLPIGNVTNIISNIPSLIPDLSKLPDIIFSNATNIIPTSLPNIPIGNLTNLPKIPSIGPIDVNINIPDINIHEPGWIGDNFFKLWVILFTTGICCLGLFGIGLGLFSLCCTYYKDSKHDYQQHPPYSISVVNSPPPENDKVKEIRNMFEENSIDSRQLAGNPSHYNANPYDEEGL